VPPSPSTGLVTRPGERVKLLAAGKLKVALTVRVQRASAAAILAVEAAGGRVELLETRPEKTDRGPSGRGDEAGATAGAATKRGDDAEAEPEG
jgi:large subunit ribosomal protein L15